MALQRSLEYEISCLTLASSERAKQIAIEKAAAEAAAAAAITTITALCDNYYTLYLNGKAILSGASWSTSQKVAGVTVKPGDILFMDAGNDGGPAALFVEMFVNGKNQATGTADWRCKDGKQTPPSAATVLSWPTPAPATGCGANCKYIWAQGGEKNNQKIGCALIVQ